MNVYNHVSTSEPGTQDMLSAHQLSLCHPCLPASLLSPQNRSYPQGLGLGHPKLTALQQSCCFPTHSSFCHLFFLKKKKNFFFCLFLAVLGLRCCTRAFSSCGERGLLLLQSMGSKHTGFSSCGTWALEHRLSSCGARA